MQPNFTPFPELVTERILLREITKKDTPEIFLLRSNAAVYQFLGKEPATSLKEAEDFIELINNKTIPEPIGRAFPVSDISEAHNLLESRESVGKLAIEWK